MEQTIKRDDLDLAAAEFASACTAYRQSQRDLEQWKMEGDVLWNTATAAARRVATARERLYTLVRITPLPVDVAMEEMLERYDRS